MVDKKNDANQKLTRPWVITMRIISNNICTTVIPLRGCKSLLSSSLEVEHLRHSCFSLCSLKEFLTPFLKDHTHILALFLHLNDPKSLKLHLYEFRIFRIFDYWFGLIFPHFYKSTIKLRMKSTHFTSLNWMSWLHAQSNCALKKMRKNQSESVFFRI